jgi:ATP-dependent helicase HrpB
LPEALALLQRRRRLVFTAEPGAGKTTRLPPFIAQHPEEAGQVLVLEPRRLAARLSAERVAFEQGLSVGKEVGFITKFERRVAADSKVVFVTEGILTRRLVKDRELRGVTTVVLDEFHERHVASDLALSLLLRLQRESRPDLKIVVMSATVDAAMLSELLDAPHLHCEGRLFPVEIVHAAASSDRPLESLVASAIFETLRRGDRRDLLVFLPGMREIRRAQSQAERLAREHDLALLPLHGTLSPQEQDAALRPNARRKVIFATNVAETSLTIEGVGHVIDSGLANLASHSPWTGLPTLRCDRISQAAAIQRAGRAGRTQRGTATRLYTEADFSRRPAFETPELLRTDLAEPLLLLLACGVADLDQLVWVSRPERVPSEAALELLSRLGALEAGRRSLTAIGRRMAELPHHPRLARALIEGERRGVGRELRALCEQLGERWDAPNDASRLSSLRSDLLERASGFQSEGGPLDGAWEDAVLYSILTGFPDRVGRLKRHPTTGKREVVFADGGSAQVSEGSRVRESDLVVAVVAKEQGEAGRQRAQVECLSAIESDWLLEVDFDRVVDEASLEVGDGPGRVFETRTLRYGKLALSIERKPTTAPEKCAPLLTSALLARGLPPEAEEKLQSLELRLQLAADHGLLEQTALPSREELVRSVAENVSTLEELAQTDFAESFVHSLSSRARSVLAQDVPERFQLGNGRAVPVVYRKGQPPTIASRLQDFFGTSKAPSLLAGRLPLVLELLAPNFRAVQITSDLDGFWRNHYPALAKELQRRYPRHAWPDDPKTAQPPPLPPPRRK